jgi:hypothetical protein
MSFHIPVIYLIINSLFLEKQEILGKLYNILEII